MFLDNVCHFLFINVRLESFRKFPFIILCYPDKGIIIQTARLSVSAVASIGLHCVWDLQPTESIVVRHRSQANIDWVNQLNS